MKPQPACRIIFVIVLAMLMTGFSCITTPDGTKDQVEQPGTDEKKDQGDTSGKDAAEIGELVVAMSPAKIDFDPLHAFSSWESQFYTAVYEGLMTYHPFTLEPLPGLARNWELSEDGRIYTFYLRDGLFYQNGDVLTATDIRDSWIRLLDPAAKSEYSVYFDIIKGAQDYKVGILKDPAGIGIRVKADNILEIELEKPATHFLKILCHMSFVPIHKSYRNRENWGDERFLITNGPYYILERNERQMVLAKNNLYWDSGRVKIKRIKVMFIEDDKEVAKLMNAGLLHWAFNGDVESIKDDAFILVNPLFSTSYLYFVCTTPALDNAKVRRGLALLLPLTDIRAKEYLFRAETLVPRLSNYPDVKGIAKGDDEEGLRLLAEAGYEGGSGLPEIVIAISDDKDSLRIAELMKQNWEKKTSAHVTITKSSHDKYFETLKKGDGYSVGMMTWIGDYPDPLTFLQLWMTGSNLNDAHYSNSEYDDLIAQSYHREGVEKYGLCAKAETIILHDAVVIPLRHYPAFNLVNTKKIEGWFPNPLDIHPFKYIQFKSDEVLPNVVFAR